MIKPSVFIFKIISDVSDDIFSCREIVKRAFIQSDEPSTIWWKLNKVFCLSDKILTRSALSSSLILFPNFGFYVTYPSFLCSGKNDGLLGVARNEINLHRNEGVYKF